MKNYLNVFIILFFSVLHFSCKKSASHQESQTIPLTSQPIEKKTDSTALDSNSMGRVDTEQKTEAISVPNQKKAVSQTSWDEDKDEITLKYDALMRLYDKILDECQPSERVSSYYYVRTFTRAKKSWMTGGLANRLRTKKEKLKYLNELEKELQDLLKTCEKKK